MSDAIKDPYQLSRFLLAQADVYSHALRELVSGHKQTHWMWFIFPQLDGLGSSFSASQYAIKFLEEASAYIEHPILGHRIIECTKTVLAIQNTSLSEIFGSPDDLKFRSCMTLFEHVAQDPSPFARALDQLCDGRRDIRSLELMEKFG